MGELFGRLKKIKGLPYALIGIVAGIALLLIGYSDGEVDNDGSLSLDEYITALEYEISQMLNAAEGISNARVMITADSGAEQQYDTRGSYLGERSPVIRGAAVICDGGNSPDVQKRVIGLICALLDISSNNVFVCG